MKKRKIVRKAKSKVVNIKKKKKKKGARVGGLILLLIVTMFSLMLTPYFNINWVEITGNDKVPQDQILSMSGIEYNSNIFKVNINDATQNILKIPYIESVIIKRKLPHGIKIELTESVGVAYMPFGTSYVMIDQNGKLLESVQSLDDKEKLPVATGIQIDNYQLGTSFSDSNPKEAKALKDLLDKLKEYELMDRVTSFDISDANNLSFVFDNGKKVIVGDSFRLDYKLMMLKAAIEEIAPSEKGTIDLTIEGKAIFSPEEE